MSPVRCICVFLITICHLSKSDTILNSTVEEDTRLSISGSPYRVTATVRIQEDVTLDIENGVEIIFMDDVDIIILGHLIMGCNDIDTSSYNNRGLADATTYTQVGSNGGARVRKGSFRYDLFAEFETVTGHEASARFCNVRFAGLQRAIQSGFNFASASTDPDKDITVDNCEFVNLDYTIYVPTDSDNAVFTDSYFYNINHMAYGHAVFRNCKFEAFGDFEDGPEIHDSELDCTEATYTCVRLEYRGGNTFENNIIRNAPRYAIDIWSSSWDGDTVIRYNEIINCSVGIECWFCDKVQLEYNNFIDNDLNLRADAEDILAPYNYWGVDTADDTAIEAGIEDVCDTQYGGLVEWWPYYIQPIDFDDLGNLPQEYTPSDFVCKGNNPFISITGDSPTLDALYIFDVTLTVDQSPYYVVHDVVIRTNVTINVENGVEIIFMDDFTVLVYGIIDIGCFDIDTSSNTQRGLADDTTFTSIHSDFGGNDGRKGQFYLNEIWWASSMESSISICNAKIESMNRPIQLNAGDIYIDNVEFIDNYWPIGYRYVSSSSYDDAAEANHIEIHDTIFDANYISLSGNPMANNIEVVNMDSNGYVGEVFYASITGSTINGGDAQRSRCITLLGAYNTFSDNIIRGCTGNAIYIEASENVIENNVIRGNGIGINIDEDYQQNDIHYNNFIQNTINIQANGYDYAHDCTLNYFASNDETEIANKINDLCDGFSSSLVMWSPYFIEPVAGVASLPASVEVQSLQCPDGDAPGTILSSVHSDDITLTAADSPYYVINNVFIPVGITLIIENGVEIIFTGPYKINIQGTVDCGCGDIRRQPQDPKTRGTYLPNFIHLHTESYDQTGYGFYIEDGGEGSFCHTVFEGFNYAFYDNNYAFYDADGSISVDNCEFKQNTYGMYGVTGRQYQVTDSIFSNNTYAISQLNYVSVDNCLFEYNYGSVSRCTDANISNSDIIGLYPKYRYECVGIIWYYRTSYFINNTVSNCYIGYDPSFLLSSFNTSTVEVMYNTFTDNVHGMDPYVTPGSNERVFVNYNNFIDNEYAAAVLNGDLDFSMPYNYFGQDGVTDPNDIADIIKDDCDVPDFNTYADGTIQFWPWLLSPFVSTNNLPDTYTINATRCPPPRPPSPEPTMAPTLEPCDCNTIELLRVFSCGAGTICYKYQAHFCNDDVRRFTLSVNGQRCGLSDVSTVIKNVRPVDMIWSINSDGNIQIDDLMDGETFTLHLDSSQVLGTNPSGIIQYRIGRDWFGCRGVENVLPDYCGR